MKYAFINNKILPTNKAFIHIQDRGFRFGDGVFETCLIQDGKIYNWPAHQARLEDGLKAIKINIINSSLHALCHTEKCADSESHTLCHPRECGDPESKTLCYTEKCVDSESHTLCHPRECGDPESHTLCYTEKSADSESHTLCHPRECGDPELKTALELKVDPRIREDDKLRVEDDKMVTLDAKLRVKDDKMRVENDEIRIEDDKMSIANNNLKELCLKLIQKNKIQNGYLRIAVSRGVGSVGYLPRKNIEPTIVIETLPLNPQPKSPIKLCISQIQKPSLKSLPINYKLAQGLNSTLAKLEAVEQNCFDAILLNEKNQICETSSANIFWIKDDVLYTPHQDCGCLMGTIREKILELSPIKTKLVKAKITDLLNADEAFITNVSLRVLAVDKIVDGEFKNKKYSKIFANLLNKDIKKYVTKTTN